MEFDNLPRVVYRSYIVEGAVRSRRSSKFRSGSKERHSYFRGGEKERNLAPLAPFHSTPAILTILKNIPKNGAHSWPQNRDL